MQHHLRRSRAGEQPETFHRPDSPEWLEAKRIGDAGESAVADIFRAMGFAVAPDESLSVDLLAFGKIEVKTDRLASTTGRVACEIAHRGRASGIASTTARTVAYIIGSEILVISTDVLRELVDDLPDVPAGEHATIRLVPIEEFRSRAIALSWPTGGGR